jgi:AcrR family transcriptional regulator
MALDDERCFIHLLPADRTSTAAVACPPCKVLAVRTSGRRGSDSAVDTRARLIDVAERLIAERGVDQVTLRAVGLESGQRNNSAAQYHFGSKDGLIAAIANARSRPIDARRAELIEELRAAPEPPGVRELINLLVLPLAEVVAGTGEQTWYLRFLANAMDQPVFDRPELPAGRDGTESPDPPGLRFMRIELQRVLHDLPAAEFERRMRWAAKITLRVLADYERHRGALADEAATRQIVADLDEALVALLQAPYPAR